MINDEVNLNCSSQLWEKIPSPIYFTNMLSIYKLHVFKWIIANIIFSHKILEILIIALGCSQLTARKKHIPLAYDRHFTVGYLYNIDRYSIFYYLMTVTRKSNCRISDFRNFRISEPVNSWSTNRGQSTSGFHVVMHKALTAVFHKIPYNSFPKT